MQSSKIANLLISQGRPSHGGNEAEIFIFLILGKFWILGERNVFVNLGGKEMYIFLREENVV